MIGGLVGTNGGTVTDCYATGSVSGLNHVGGLIGRNTTLVSNCYAACAVSGSSIVGGLVGDSVAEVTDSCWDTQASGQATSEGGVGVVGKTTAEMMQLATFSGWDMTGVDFGELDPSCVWNVIDGHSYPFFGCCRMQFELKTGWNMVSVPRELPPGKDTVAEVFKGEIVAIYWWNPSSKSYVVPTTVEPDCGYWVAVTEDKVITYMV